MNNTAFSPGMYTLDQLHHVNMLLFPDDFADCLANVGGLDPDVCDYLKAEWRTQVKHGRPLELLYIYQNYALNDDTFAEALERVIQYYCRRTVERWKG